MTPVLLADFSGHDLGNALIRWIHVVAGVLWIGHLYFFNFVNGQFAATLDAETKKKVVPELMPRALFWFRWGAAYTWLSGLLLLFMLYYFGPYYTTDATRPSTAQWGASLAVLIVGFVVYDGLCKAMAKQVVASIWVWGILSTVVGWAMTNVDFFGASARAAQIHVGALFGTAMAANVWMRIWPAQKRIMTAIKNGEKPDPADPAIAGARSKHNTYMSVPLLFLMLSVHMQQVGVSFGDPVLWIGGSIVIGFIATQRMYAMAGNLKGW